MAELIKIPLQATLDDIEVLKKTIHSVVLDRDMEDILNAYYLSNNKSKDSFLNLPEAKELKEYLSEIYNRFLTFSV